MNERIMSEQEISVFYNVSRITARHALEDLEKQGYIFRIRGKGSYVCWDRPTEVPFMNKDSTVYRWVNYFHGKTVLEDLRLISISHRLQKYYDVPDETPGLTFNMKRYTGKTVTYYSYFPLLSTLDISQYPASYSIRSTYLEHGVYPMRYVQRLVALMSDDIIAEKYHVPADTVVLFEMLAFYDGQNRLMELTLGCYEQSDSILTVKLE